MAGHRESVLDSFDELNHRKVQKTKVDVRSENAKKFMNMFNKGEVPEGMNAGDRTTLEKDMELEMMRTKKRGERDFFKNMEKGEIQDDAPKEPKLLIGKLKAVSSLSCYQEELLQLSREKGLIQYFMLQVLFTWYINYSTMNSLIRCNLYSN